MPSAIQRAGEMLRHSTYTVALTGAGISTPSGIPDFRSPHSGLWTQANPMEVASLWAFYERPQAFYRWFGPLLQTLQTARPNAAHRVLAEMEAAGRLAAIITQNIDSLHQAAGSQHVLEVHGHTRTATCLACGRCVPATALTLATLHDAAQQSDAPPDHDTLSESATLPESAALPRCPACGSVLKPDVVLFGEPLPYELLSAAQQEALACNVMLVIGTSLEVMPAADLPLLAQRRGARIILVNRSPTPLDAQMDVVIHADVIQTLERLWQMQDRPKR
jgi:NAD-dependent deacetylase